MSEYHRKPTRAEELRASIATAERSYRAAVEKATKAARDEEITIVADVTERVRANGVALRDAMEGLAERKHRERRQIEREHDAAVRRAQSERDAAFSRIGLEIAEAQQIARDANRAACAPLEVELRERRDAHETAGTAVLEDLRRAHEAAVGPLRAELDAIEKAAIEKALAAKAAPEAAA